MTEPRVRVAIPGSAYYAGVEPSAVPAEESWPIPTLRRCGRGVSAVYYVTGEQAAAMADHFDVLGECFAETDSADSRACRVACDRLRHAASAAATGGDVPT